MSRSELKPGTVHPAHRTLRATLNEAVRREHITKNPAVLARAPRLDDEEVEPFTLDGGRHLLAAASERRNGVRRVVALSVVLRKGEALGLRGDVDLDAGMLRIRHQLQRPTFAHECGTCGRKPGRCRQRVQHDDHVVDTKSKVGRRGIGLPAPVVEMLRFHKASQDMDGPSTVRTDHNRWKALLVDAGVRDARLQDARHTAATMLLLLGVPDRGVPDRAVMATMGWSHASMAARCQHVTGTICQDIADRVGGLL